MSGEMATETKLDLRTLTAEMVRPLVGQTFVFQRPVEQQTISGGRVELELLEVASHDGVVQRESAYPGSHLKRSRVPFSLLFVLKENLPALEVGLHRLKHEAFQQELWHIARVHVPGRDPGRAYYEAVFA